MSFVDHIEFVKGPAGFMLANGDPSGLYNLVTKKPTGQTKERQPADIRSIHGSEESSHDVVPETGASVR